MIILLGSHLPDLIPFPYDESRVFKDCSEVGTRRDTEADTVSPPYHKLSDSLEISSVGRWVYVEDPGLFHVPSVM